MAAKYKFTEAEKQQVEAAVKDLEIDSCGEIVPYFVRSSDDYSETSWYLATLAGALSAVAIGILSYAWMLPIQLTPLEVSLTILFFTVFGFLVPIFIPITKRWVVPKQRQAYRVSQRANEAFLNESVFNTEERVGVLIFISRLEHMVLVIGDEGINKKVQQQDWEHVVDEVVIGVKQKQIGHGLVKAIALCKELLMKNGFVRKSTDTNELDDSLRIED